jgi:hypothetical protein
MVFFVTVDAAMTRSYALLFKLLMGAVVLLILYRLLFFRR